MLDIHKAYKKYFYTQIFNYNLNEIERDLFFFDRTFNNHNYLNDLHFEHFESGSNLFFLGEFEIGFLESHSSTKPILYKYIEETIKNTHIGKSEGFKDIDKIIAFADFGGYDKNKIGLTYKQYLEAYEEEKEDKKRYTKQVTKPYFIGFAPSRENYFELVKSVDFWKNQLKKKLPVFIPLKERYKHTHITGGSGSGKSEALKSLVYSVVQTQRKSWFNSNDNKVENFILLDPHGDLADDIFNFCCRNYKKEQIGETIILDPFLDPKKTPVINPLEFKGNVQELNSYSEELLNVFKEVLGAEFSLNAEALLIPCIVTLLKLENTSLYDLQRFMNDENNSDLVEKGKNTDNYAHKNFFESSFYSSNLNATKRAVFLKIQTLLNNQTFSDLTTGKSTLNIEKIMNNQKNLIVKLNKKKMKETIKPFGRFIVARVQSVALKREELYENLRPKTHFFIDECQNFISPTIEEILTESRKYRLFLTLAHQTITQLESSVLRDLVLSNTNVKIVGSNGSKTLSYLAKEIHADHEDLKGLEVGQFFVKIGSKVAFKINTKRVSLQETKKPDYAEDMKQIILKYHYVNKLKKSEYGQTAEQEKIKDVEVLKTKKKPKFDTF